MHEPAARSDRHLSLTAEPCGRGEAGTGTVGTVVGVLMFLVLLLFASQLLLHLYATSVVNAAAFDALRVASRAPLGATPQELQSEGADRFARLVGGYAGDGRLRLEWCPTAEALVADDDATCGRFPGRYALTVRMRHPSLLRQVDVLPLQELTRTVTLRREAVS